MCVQHFYGQGPHPLFRAGSRAAREKKKLAISGIPVFLNYRVIFIEYIYVTYKCGGGPATHNPGLNFLRINVHAGRGCQVTSNCITYMTS